MSTRGWEDFSESDVQRFNRRVTESAKGVMPSEMHVRNPDGRLRDTSEFAATGGVTHPPKSTSKYRNVRVSVQGQKFDSQREADQFLALRAREAAGEIAQLRCQVPFDLECPIYSTRTGDLIQCATVAQYVADFTWRDRNDVLHVADAKGVRTKEYRLKAKWMNLQFGIVVEEL